MAAPVFCCGFECGVDTAHWTLGGATFSTLSPLSGLRSLRANPSASVQSATTLANYGAGIWTYRFTVNFATLPNATVNLCENVVNVGVYFKSSDSKIYAGSALTSLGATGVSIVAGTTYYIDVRVNVTNNPWLI